MTTNNNIPAPTLAFKLSSIIALLAGTVAYCIGLYNAEMALNEKGYYFAILFYGLFAAVSVQKSVRDKQDGIEISQVYYLISWISVAIALSLLIIGLYNADLLLSEKGFYGMAYTLSLFSSITIQKNIRDSHLIKDEVAKENNDEELMTQKS